jgi:hypothetical protein
MPVRQTQPSPFGAAEQQVATSQLGPSPAAVALPPLHLDQFNSAAWFFDDALFEGGGGSGLPSLGSILPLGSLTTSRNNSWELFLAGATAQ